MTVTATADQLVRAQKLLGCFRTQNGTRCLEHQHNVEVCPEAERLAGRLANELPSRELAALRAFADDVRVLAHNIQKGTFCVDDNDIYIQAGKEYVAYDLDELLVHLAEACS